MNTKIYIFLLFFGGLFFGISQKATDYQYIIVSDKFKDFKPNQYNLNKLLRDHLKKKNYIILTEHVNSWTDDVRLDPCKALTADVLDESNMFKNKIKLVLKDCNGKEIFTNSTGSDYKEFDLGFQDALKKSVLQLAVYQPSNSTIDKSIINPNTNQNDSTKKERKFQSTTGKKILFVEEQTNQITLYNDEDQSIFATLASTGIKNVYRVQISGSKNCTIAYFDGINLQIDYARPDQNGISEVLEFKKLP